MSLVYLCTCRYEKRNREQPPRRRRMAARSSPTARPHPLSPAKLSARRSRNRGLSFLYSSLSFVSSPISSDSLSLRLPTATRPITSPFHWVSRPVDSFPSLLVFALCGTVIASDTGNLASGGHCACDLVQLHYYYDKSLLHRF